MRDEASAARDGRGEAAPPIAAPHRTPRGDALALAFLAALVGAIGGWLIGQGALPLPAFLAQPLAGRSPLAVTAILALAGAIIGGVVGAVNATADSLRAREVGAAGEGIGDEGGS